MRISDWSSDVCSSDLMDALRADLASETLRQGAHAGLGARKSTEQRLSADRPSGAGKENGAGTARNHAPGGFGPGQAGAERKRGRAPGRERVCQSVLISVVGG